MVTTKPSSSITIPWPSRSAPSVWAERRFSGTVVCTPTTAGRASTTSAGRLLSPPGRRASTPPWAPNHRPAQILAVTFTNKAAREMLDRVASLIGGAADGMWLGTFHAIGVRVLRRHAELVGLKSNFTILDTDDQTRLIKQLLQAENIDDKKWPARVLSHIIQRWKDRALTPDKVSPDDAGEFANGRAADIYRQYQARLAEVNAVDFGHLVMLCVSLR